MNCYTSFILGFIAGSGLLTALCIAYYCRARRRVKSICGAIERYHQASNHVNDALKRLDNEQAKA